MRFRNSGGQLTRWLSVLSEYSFDIQHRSDSKHSNADGLSLIPVEIECDCYTAGQSLESLPCKECHFCTRVHEQWRRFEEEVDDVVPLSVRTLKLIEDGEEYSVKRSLKTLRNCICHLLRHHMSLILTIALWLTPRVWWCQNWTMMRGCHGMWGRLDVFLLGDQSFFHSTLPRNYKTYRCRILICNHCFGGWMLRVIPHKPKYICQVLLQDRCGIIGLTWSWLMECCFMYGRRHPTHVICLSSRRRWRRKCWWCIMTPW